MGVERAAAQNAITTCGITIFGNVTNSNFSVSCTNVANALQDVEQIAGEQTVSPELLRLVRNGDFANAMQMIERLVATQPAAATTYLSIGASLALAEGSRESALQYSRRAYTLNRNDALLILRYQAALVVNGRQEEARGLITDALRRRADLVGSGTSLLDTVALEMEYSPEVLQVWLRNCPQATVGEQASDGRLLPCVSDPEARRNVLQLRERLVRLERDVAAVRPAARLSLQVRHYLLHFRLLCDHILGDQAAASETERSMEEAAALIDARFGPWSLLTSFLSEARLDLITPATYLRRKYRLVDRALDEAANTPIAALGAGTPDEEVLPRFSGVMLASFRATRAMAALRLEDTAVAWSNFRLALTQARQAGNTRPALEMRLSILGLMITSINANHPAFDPSLFRTEHNLIRDIFVRDPRWVTPLGNLFDNVQGLICEEGILSDSECAQEFVTDEDE